jgi:hypothetical protein
MKISVNDIELYTLTETQKKVIQNDINSDIFDDDMRRRLKQILLDEKYKKCYERLEKEWLPKLRARGVASVPTDPDQFANLVFSQPDYKNRKVREQEAKLIADAEAK